MIIPEALSIPFSLTLGAIPVTYLLGIISGNVSWVDRAWPFYPVLCSTLVLRWAFQQSGDEHKLAIPRLLCMVGLQVSYFDLGSVLIELMPVCMVYPLNE